MLLAEGLPRANTHVYVFFFFDVAVLEELFLHLSMPNTQQIGCLPAPPNCCLAHALVFRLGTLLICQLDGRQVDLAACPHPPFRVHPLNPHSRCHADRPGDVSAAAPTASTTSLPHTGVHPQGLWSDQQVPYAHHHPDPLSIRFDPTTAAFINLNQALQV